MTGRASWQCLDGDCRAGADDVATVTEAASAFRAHWMVAHNVPPGPRRPRARRTPTQAARDAYLAERELLRKGNPQ